MDAARTSQVSPSRTPTGRTATPRPASEPSPHDAGRFAGSVERSEIPNRRQMQELVTASAAQDTAAPYPAADLRASAKDSPDLDRDARNEVVDRMLERGMGGRPVPEASSEALQDALSVVPLDVLRTVDRNNTRVVVMRDGETPLDVGVVQPLDVGRAFAETDGLKAVADRAFTAADEKYGSQIADLEARVAAARDKASEWGQPNGALDPTQIGGDPVARDPEVMKLDAELVRLRSARNREAFEAILKQSDGRLAGFSVPGAGSGPTSPMMLSMMNNGPQSIESIAALHGAHTPEEVREFAEQFKALNGERLTAVQEAFMQGLPANAPPELKEQWSNLPVEQRLFFPGQSDIAVPQIYWHRRDPENAAEKPTVMDGHDYRSILDWQRGSTRGQYWYQGDRNTIVLRESGLGKNADGHSIPIHELGHAYEDAMSQLDPQGFSAWDKERDAAFERLSRSGTGAFPTLYATTNADEMAAESFASRFSDDPGELHRLDPGWAGAFERFLAAAGLLGSQP